MNDWPHAPLHRFDKEGIYMVTAGTYNKQHFFRSSDRLQFIQDTLLKLTKEYNWNLQAWAIFSNHYHFIVHSHDDCGSLRSLISQLHASTAQYANAQDGTLNRQVWFQYWDTHLSIQSSYMSRLNYVNQNPMRHGLVPSANLYPWCSAAWFERVASPSFYSSVKSFKIDRVKVVDDF